jgi:galactose-1-phosphate uridylyltransferase
MAIEFKKVTYEAAPVLSPLTQFQPDAQTLEYRWDPLTGWKQNYNIRYMDKAAMFYGPADEKLMEELAESSRSNCPFCPHNIEKVTPKFPPEIFPEGSFRLGESRVMPNLFQIYDFTVVTVMANEHFLKLNEFTPDKFNDAFKATIHFFNTVHKAKPECCYPIIGMNYMAPAGSSQFHPHLQVYLSQLPYQFIDYLIRRSKTYLQENSANYWQELIETEKRIGERYISRNNNIEWLAPFCPMGQDEIQGIIRGKSNFSEFDDDDIKTLSDGICNILRFYKEVLKKSSFNFLIYSGPLEGKCDEFWSNIRIASRPNFAANYANDIHLAQLFYLESWYPSIPENLAKSLRQYLGY